MWPKLGKKYALNLSDAGLGICSISIFYSIWSTNNEKCSVELAQSRWVTIPKSDRCVVHILYIYWSRCVEMFTLFCHNTYEKVAWIPSLCQPTHNHIFWFPSNTTTAKYLVHYYSTKYYVYIFHSCLKTIWKHRKLWSQMVFSPIE